MNIDTTTSTNTSDSVRNSLARYFWGLLPRDRRVERLCCLQRGAEIDVHVIIPEPDFDLERPIYEAEMAFMDRFREFSCDFTVIYRFNKALEDLTPTGWLVLSSDILG